MGTHKGFTDLIEQESACFSAICKMMYHSKVDLGRNFLCAMNNIVDYYTKRVPEQSINYHVIYLPTCPDWAQELLVRFLIQKVAFTYSSKLFSIAKKKTTGPMVLPEGVSSKHKRFKLIQEERAYYSKLLKLFGNRTIDNETEGKSLFIVQEKDITTRKQDKNPWLEQLYATDFLYNDFNAIVTCDQTADDVEAVIRSNRNNVPNIDNIFVFHSQNRGKTTYSYNLDQLERLNQYGVGIKNCFVFYISEQPFRLYYAKQNIKETIVSNLLKREIKRFDDFDGFITFTPEELDLFFDRDPRRGQFRIIDSDERDIFTSNIDSIFDELPHNYRIKNSLSLAFTHATQNAFIEECEEEAGISIPQDVKSFLNYYKHFWNEEIKLRLIDELNYYHTVAFVLPPGTNKVYKDIIKKIFSSETRKVYVVDFNQLRDGLYVELVVLFSFRYTDEKYKTYPNSFDPLPLKEGQHGLTIINRLTHNNYYEWNRYFYDKDLNGLLFSSFRSELIGWNKRSIKKPIIPNIISNLDEAEADAREYMAERCSVVFDDYNTIRRLVSERILYSDGDCLCVSSLKELLIEKSQLQDAVSEVEGKKVLMLKDVKIQLLDDLVEQIKDNLIKRTDADLKAESFIRRDPQYGLSEEQISSGIELWKYLLKRKIDELGLKKSYEAIFPKDKDISLKGFERWTDFDYPMILPRSRRSQNSLLSFLGFGLGSPYHRAILTKKLIKNSNTRMLNNQIESLLQSILTSPVNDDSFDDLFDEHSEILTLLEINSASEIKTLIQLLDINLKPFIVIVYDSDKTKLS